MFLRVLKLVVTWRVMMAFVTVNLHCDHRVSPDLKDEIQAPSSYHQRVRIRLAPPTFTPTVVRMGSVSKSKSGSY